MTAQLDAGEKTNEITRYKPLLETMTDLEDAVGTTDALHNQCEHDDYLRDRGAHYIVIVKGNQKKLRSRSSPFRGSRFHCRTAATAPGTAEARSAGSRCAP
ncbi:hypothetical protein [Streptomyces mirabilis]|uniref:hypothetical protein n=1 Tax=Streptomyces mirabilis TaxID=68239 RepID=UPI0036D94C3D